MKPIHNILFTSGKPWVIHTSGQQPVYFDYNPVGDNTKVYSSLPNDWERNYTYDMLGRRLTYQEGELVESLTYNGGNLASHSQSWLENGNTQTRTTTYHYNAHRLDSVGYDDALTTIYHYDQYSRVDSLYDESGVMCYTYGNMGEVTKETRIYALPFLNSPFALTTHFDYDSWGRIQSVTYPDNEVVSYAYDLGGQLQRMYNVQCTMNNGCSVDYIYLDNVTYDRFGAKVSQTYGNGLVTSYSYSNLTRRLSTIATMNGNSQLSTFAYTYDPVGNVTQVTSSCPWLNNQSFTESFTYDASDQLVSASETQAQSYQLAVTYGNWGKISGYSLAQTDLQNNTTQSETQAYTYPATNSIGNSQTLFAPEQRTITDANNNVSTETLTFGINGSLRKREVQGVVPHTEHYLFNSQANLIAYSNNLTDFAYYGYNASNTRAYKLGLSGSSQWVNGQQQSLHLGPQQAMFYPNAYTNFNQNGEYTKHYYNGTERIASRLGDNQQTIEAEANDRLLSRIAQTDEIFKAQIGEMAAYEEPAVNVPARGNGEGTRNLLFPTVGYDPIPAFTDLQPTGNATDIFYYHTNHLGSTAFVTDQNQTVTQGFLYAPFGEITTEYNANFGNNVLPKYSFNAKELDEETGMYYYEARYYKPPVFTSRDPMYEKYPTFSPYTYCANNPVKYVDPSGRAFDPTQDENYIKPMEDDIKKKIAERTAMRDKCKVGSKKYNRLNEHITELNKALTEISDLRKDENNLYFLTFGDIMFNKDAGGEFADCAGLLTYGGQNNGMTQININIAAKYSGTSSTMLHEFKHAFQYYEGKLGFYIDNYVTPSISSSNSMPLEKEAHFRASVYSFANTKSFNQFIFCINGYEDLDVFLSPSIQHHSIAQRNGKIYINNSKSYDPYKK
jgi:RHS repeat-associated protein